MKVKVWEKIREEKMRGGFVDTFLYVSEILNKRI